MARQARSWLRPAGHVGREHRFSQRQLQSVLDDALADPVTRRVLRHVAGCDDCQHDARVWRDVKLAVHRVAVAMDPMAIVRARQHLDRLRLEP